MMDHNDWMGNVKSAMELEEMLMRDIKSSHLDKDLLFMHVVNTAY